MKTSQEIKDFVDKHGLYAADNFGKSSNRKFDFATSLLRVGEEATFAVVCNTISIKDNGKKIGYYSGNGLGFTTGALLLFTNRRMIVTEYLVPKREPRYAAFELTFDDKEQNWDIIEVRANMFRISTIIVRFDDGFEIQLTVKPKKCKHIIDELRKFLNEKAAH